jgi:hypothetical protein
MRRMVVALRAPPPEFHRCARTGSVGPAPSRNEAANKRLHHNVLAIALANKLARIAWSVLARGRNFEARKITAAAQ